MSTTAFLEIVEIESGEVVLRRADSSEGSSEPMVSIKFSPEVRALFPEHIGSIARAMMGAGVQMAGHIKGGTTVMEEDEPRQLH